MVWKSGVISPIPKCSSSDPRVPLNYRGISLLPVASKLYTASISTRLTKYLETNNLLADEQNGFRANRSTLDHIFSLHNICQTRKNLWQGTFLTFIDFQKAFDYVNHDFLYHKLLNNNINVNILTCIQNIYGNSRSCVQLNGQLAPWFEVTSGVRQGDSLSPLLFAVFINDLASEMNAANAGVCIGGEQVSLLYADDIVLLSGNSKQA